MKFLHIFWLPIFVVLFVMIPIANENDNKIKTQQVTTQWLGWPVYALKYNGIDPGIYGGNPPPSQWVDKGHIMGLRSDGVVIWKDAAENKETK